MIWGKKYSDRPLEYASWEWRPFFAYTPVTLNDGRTLWWEHAYWRWDSDIWDYTKNDFIIYFGLREKEYTDVINTDDYRYARGRDKSGERWMAEG